MDSVRNSEAGVSAKGSARKGGTVDSEAKVEGCGKGVGYHGKTRPPGAPAGKVPQVVSAGPARGKRGFRGFPPDAVTEILVDFVLDVRPERDLIRLLLACGVCPEAPAIIED